MISETDFKDEQGFVDSSSYCSMDNTIYSTYHLVNDGKKDEKNVHTITIRQRDYVKAI